MKVVHVGSQQARTGMTDLDAQPPPIHRHPAWIGGNFCLLCLASLVQAHVVGGTIDYRVKFVKGHAYLYERTYVGSAGDSKPVRSERYLGRVDDVRARAAGQLELKFMAVALARELAVRKGRARSSEAASRAGKGSRPVRSEASARGQSPRPTSRRER
jgi:hypothetical protein